MAIIVYLLLVFVPDQMNKCLEYQQDNLDGIMLAQGQFSVRLHDSCWLPPISRLWSTGPQDTLTFLLHLWADAPASCEIYRHSAFFSSTISTTIRPSDCRSMEPEKKKKKSISSRALSHCGEKNLASTFLKLPNSLIQIRVSNNIP